MVQLSMYCTVYTKLRPLIAFLNVGVANTLIRQIILIKKFVDLNEFLKFGFLKKLPLKSVCHTNIDKFYQRMRFSLQISSLSTTK